MIYVFSGDTSDFDSAVADLLDKSKKISRVLWASQLDTAKPTTLYFVGTWSLNPNKDSIIEKCKQLQIRTVFVHDNLSLV